LTVWFARADAVLLHVKENDEIAVDLLFICLTFFGLDGYALLHLEDCCFASGL
jgi:hypothetical protein